MCGRFVGFRPIEVLRQYFTHRPVSKAVNSTRNNSPAWIDPLFDQATPSKNPP